MRRPVSWGGNLGQLGEIICPNPVQALWGLRTGSLDPRPVLRCTVAPTGGLVNRASPGACLSPAPPAKGLRAQVGGVMVLPENWVHLLMGVKPKDRAKLKIRRTRFYYYLQQVSRTLWIFPKAVSP